MSRFFSKYIGHFSFKLGSDLDDIPAGFPEVWKMVVHAKYSRDLIFRTKFTLFGAMDEKNAAVRNVCFRQ